MSASRAPGSRSCELERELVPQPVEALHVGGELIGGVADLSAGDLGRLVPLEVLHHQLAQARGVAPVEGVVPLGQELLRA